MLITRDIRIFRQNIIAKHYLFFLIFSFFSITWAVNYDLSISYFNRLIVAYLDIVIIYYIISKYNIQNSILIGILIGTLYNYLIAFNILKPNFETYEFGRFLGSVGNPNKLSRILILNLFVSLFFLRRDNNSFFKIIIVANILLTFYLTFLTVSKKGMFLIPLIILLSVDYRKIKIKKILSYSVLIIIFFSLLVRLVPDEIKTEFYEKNIYRIESFFSGVSGHTGDDSTYARMILVKDGIKLFYENPIIGVGLNNFRVFLGKYAHNNYLEVAVNTGIIGFVLFYIIYFHLFKNVIKVNDKILRRLLVSAIVVILIMDFTTVTYFDKLVIIFLVYIYSISKNTKSLSA